MATYSMTAPGLGSLEDPQIESIVPERAGGISELDDIDELVRLHQVRIRRFVAYSTGDPDMADTITQDTLLRAYRGRESFRGDCSINTWLTGIAINVIRDHLRSNRFRFWKQVQGNRIDVDEMASLIPSDAVSPERQVLAKERVRQMYAALETLSHNQRTIFLMKFTEEMSVEEISEALGMAVNTVRTHLHRALKAVRTRLGASQ